MTTVAAETPATTTNTQLPAADRIELQLGGLRINKLRDNQAVVIQNLTHRLGAPSERKDLGYFQLVRFGSLTAYFAKGRFATYEFESPLIGPSIETDASL